MQACAGRQHSDMLGLVRVRASSLYLLCIVQAQAEGEEGGEEGGAKPKKRTTRWGHARLAGCQGGWQACRGWSVLDRPTNG